jgi:hypothetical protein
MGNPKTHCGNVFLVVPGHSCITALRCDFYAGVAAIIRDNPSKTYETLMAEYGFTPWTIKMAVRLNEIKRARGRKVSA